MGVSLERLWERDLSVRAELYVLPAAVSNHQHSGWIKELWFSYDLVVCDSSPV